MSGNKKPKSKLEQMKREKNTLKSRFSDIGNIAFTSWVNDFLPDILWSCLIVSNIERDVALEIFRKIIQNYSKNKDKLNNYMLGHSQMALMSEEGFDHLFSEICEDPEINKALAPLLTIDTLPDIEHWRRVLKVAVPEDEEAAHSLILAVARCFDHQSQEATDCRWLKVMTLIAQERIQFAEEMASQFDELVNYPNMGDMRSVRPSIRATEIATRNIVDKDAVLPYSEKFWQYGWDNTRCITLNENIKKDKSTHKFLFDQIPHIYESLNDHFRNTISTTNIDARHDGSFGIVFYVIHLMYYSFNADSGQTIVSRSVLRTVLECFLTLSYLAKKDEPTIWLQFRNYGNGQTKLAYFKNLEADELPDFLTLKMLEDLANEDMWHEFLDIQLGVWANKNLRQMAEDAGEKPVYDKYYDTLSAYVHGSWMAVKYTTFTQCLNPLHRYHRIPTVPKEFDEDAIPDLVKLANRTLNKLAMLYPPFKPRFKLQPD